MQKAIEIGATGRNVADNILRLRKIRGVSTYRLAEVLAQLGRPIGQAAVSRIERGVRRVNVDDLAALAVALGVEPSQLMLPPSDLKIDVFIGGGGETR